MRGELDDIPEIRDADEEFLVLKDFGLDANGDLLTQDPSPQIMQGREGDLVLVNGEVNPIFQSEGGSPSVTVFECFGRPLLSTSVGKSSDVSDRHRRRAHRRTV